MKPLSFISLYFLITALLAQDNSTEGELIFSRQKHSMTKERVQGQLKLYGKDAFIVYFGRTTTLEAAYREAMGGKWEENFTQITLRGARYISSYTKDKRHSIFSGLLPGPQKLGKRKIVLSRNLIDGISMKEFIPLFLRYFRNQGYAKESLILDFTVFEESKRREMSDVSKLWSDPWLDKVNISLRPFFTADSRDLINYSRYKSIELSRGDQSTELNFKKLNPLYSRLREEVDFVSNAKALCLIGEMLLH